MEHLHTLYVRMNIGLTEPWPPTPWTAGQMRTDLLWNPEFSYGGGGDFLNYVAAVSGTGPLRTRSVANSKTSTPRGGRVFSTSQAPFPEDRRAG